MRRSGMFSAAPQFQRPTVKLEIQDSLEDQHAPLHKRSKHELGSCSFLVPPLQYNPLNEPSPLGLNLRKSPSLLDLIQMRLSQGSNNKVGAPVKKEPKAAASNNRSKRKASNFRATVLRIGTWEYKSRYEGDLVAKCYFAKHKLVWEVLDGALKNKIEIQWSDIVALKATYADDQPGTLDVVFDPTNSGMGRPDPNAMEAEAAKHVNQQVFKVLEALKQASQDLQTKSSNSNSSAIKALLQLETEADSILSGDPILSTLSDHLSNLKSLIQTLQNSHRRLSLKSILTRRASSHEISRVAGSIESKIQSWIDRETIENLTASLEQSDSDEVLVQRIDQLKGRISEGFNRELQDLIMKSQASLFAN